MCVCVSWSTIMKREDVRRTIPIAGSHFNYNHSIPWNPLVVSLLNPCGRLHRCSISGRTARAAAENLLPAIAAIVCHLCCRSQCCSLVPLISATTAALSIIVRCYIVCPCIHHCIFAACSHRPSSHLPLLHCPSLHPSSRRVYCRISHCRWPLLCPSALCATALSVVAFVVAYVVVFVIVTPLAKTHPSSGWFLLCLSLSALHLSCPLVGSLKTKTPKQQRQ
jgi:hypothetical protein